MGAKRKTIKLFLFLLLIFTLAYLYIEIETDLLYPKLTVQPLKIDWRVFYVEQFQDSSVFTPNQSGRLIGISVWFENGMPTNRTIVKMNVPPPYNISSISFKIKNAFEENMTAEIATTPDLGNQFDVFQNVNGVFWVYQNTTKLNEYKSQNPKDIILTGTLFGEENFSTWVVVWNYFSTQERFSIPMQPFLVQTSFDTWEAKYLFDSSKRDYVLQNISYEDANVNKLTFSATVPTGYSVQDAEYRDLATDIEGNVIVYKELQKGETFHLTVTDDANARIKSVAGNIIIGIGVFSSALSFFYAKIKKKIDEWRKPKTS